MSDFFIVLVLLSVTFSAGFLFGIACTLYALAQGWIGEEL